MQSAHESVITGNQDEAAPGVDLAAQMKKLFRKLFFLIPLGVIGSIVITLSTGGRSVMHTAMHVVPGYVIIAMVLSIVPWFTGSLRMYIWGRFLGNNLRYRDVLKIAIGAELGAAVSLPLIGGSPVKIGMLMQQGFTGGSALSLAVLEGLEDSVFFLSIVPIALGFSASWDVPAVKTCINGLRHPSVWLSGTGVAIIALLMIIITRHRAIENFIRRFPALRMVMVRISALYRQFIKTYQDIIRKGKAIFLLTMTLTALQWVCRYSIISVLLLSLGLPARPMLYLALQVIVFALMTFVPSPGGAGGAEAVFYMIHRSFLPADVIGIVTFGWRFFTFYFLLLLAAVLFFAFALRPSRHRLQKKTFQPQNG